MFLGEIKMRELMCLDDLKFNEYGYISDINCSDDVKKRLLDLGLVKNTCIIPILKSPSGGIKAFDIRGSLIAIRNEDSNLINVYRK